MPESCKASMVAQMVKNMPAMQKTWVRSLGWEDPLEEDMATYSSILEARISEWAAMPTSQGSFQPRDRTQVFCIAGRFFTI